ncbi:MAG: phosphatidylglycerophosphatase A [Burkholderiales bacterium]
MLRPTPAFAYSHPAHIVAFGFGAGLARFAPGTFGTLAAWGPGWLLADAHPAVFFPLVAALFLLGVWACGVTGRHLGVHDHGSMVWDEIVAFLLVAALLPRSFQWQVAGFVLFRGFDIGKPPPIRWIEQRWQGGFGVMFDDLVAAGYTLLLLALVRRLFF